MQSTTNYGLNIVEGTDIVNPLTQFNPNFTDIDTIMKANADASIDHATCIKTGTVHAVTRTNTDASVFRFTATGDWNTGDTMTVDGTLVSVYATDGTSPVNNCFIINTEVLASIQGTRVTLYTSSTSATNVSYDNTSSGMTATNMQDAIDELEQEVQTVDSKVIKYTSLLNQTNVPTVETVYSCNWQDYGVLSFELRRYSSVRETIVTSRYYFSTTTSSGRVMITSSTGMEIEIWQNGNGSIIAKANQAAADWGIYIFGISIDV